MLKRTPVALLLLSLVIGPLILGSYYAPWRYPLIYTAFAAGLMLVCWPLSRKEVSPNPALKAMIGLVVLLLIQGLWMWWNATHDFTREPTEYSDGIPWSLVPRDDVPFPGLPGAHARNVAWASLQYVCPALLLVWGVARWTARNPKLIRWVAITIYYTGLAVALLGLIFKWTGAPGPFWSSTVMGFIDKQAPYPLFFSTFRSPGIASAYLNISLVLGLSLMLRQLCQAMRRKGGAKMALLYLLGSILILNGILAAGSKAGIALACLSILLWAAMNFSLLRKVTQSSHLIFPRSTTADRWVIGGALLLIVLLTGLAWSGTAVFRWQEAVDGDFSSMAGRVEVNACQIKMIQDPEWGALGYGPGAFYPMFPYYAHGTNLTGVYYYAHNDHLQTLVEWGWLGFTAFAGLIGGSCWMLVRGSVLPNSNHSLGRRAKVMRRGVFIAIFICLLHATIDFPFQIESIAITMAVLIGLGWGCSRPTGSKSKPRAAS